MSLSTLAEAAAIILIIGTIALFAALGCGA